MKVTKLFTMFDLAQELEGGYVKKTKHPELPLFICNYTPKAQYEERWNPVTLACRGLVFDYDGDVVARPFEKFHNLDHDNLPPLHSRVLAYDKIDGSLGIVFKYEGSWHVATRGSFTSDQAQWANEKLPDYLDALEGPAVPEAWTFLVEIVYPQNRIVCKYDYEGLVLLGARHIPSGDFRGPSGFWWPGTTTNVLTTGTLQDALELPPRENAEGLVLHIEDHGMWKLKQDDYVALHRLMFGLNERRLWEIAACLDLRREGYTVKQVESGIGIDPRDVEQIWERYPTADYLGQLESELPEEFAPWLDRVDWKLSALFGGVFRGAQGMVGYASLKTDNKKDFAQIVKNYAYPQICFAIYDDKPYRHMVWKAIKLDPEPMTVQSEEDV